MLKQTSIFYQNGTDYEELSPFSLSLPIGIIVMWSGTVETIPSSWVLCDGSNGTPDLRDRFIVGAGGRYIIGTTGGSDTVTLEEAQMPKHSHSFTGNFKTDKALTRLGYASDGSGSSPSYIVGSNRQRSGTTSILSHFHTITGEGTIGEVGRSQSHENRPPYYALCFIMKVV